MSTSLCGGKWKSLVRQSPFYMVMEYDPIHILPGLEWILFNT